MLTKTCLESYGGLNLFNTLTTFRDGLAFRKIEKNPGRPLSIVITQTNIKINEYI